MNRQEIDALVKTMNVDTATGPVDTRVQQITVRLTAVHRVPSKVRYMLQALPNQ